MPFTGKATYTAGSNLPEIAEDVSDLISLNSPYETPLLNFLGDPAYAAHSTVHEWLEDALQPNVDYIATVTDSTHLIMSNAAYFRVGDQCKVELASELMLVTAVDMGSGTITVVRGYGGTSTATLAPGSPIVILGNAALEGDDAGSGSAPRARGSPITRRFSPSPSKSAAAKRRCDIWAWPMSWITRRRSARGELLRDLENSVINGIAAPTDPQGTSAVRRTMRGIISSIASNIFTPGSGGFPSDTTLTETQLNTALRNIWQNASSNVDLLVMGGGVKRAVNNFIGSNRRFDANTDVYQNLVSVYESDFGVCQIVVSRNVPQGTVLLLDSSRISVLPLAGRSFQFQPLAHVGDRVAGQVLGEYTLELRNQNVPRDDHRTHGLIRQ